MVAWHCCYLRHGGSARPRSAPSDQEDTAHTPQWTWYGLHSWLGPVTVGCHPSDGAKGNHYNTEYVPSPLERYRSWQSKVLVQKQRKIQYPKEQWNERENVKVHRFKVASLSRVQDTPSWQVAAAVCPAHTVPSRLEAHRWPRCSQRSQERTKHWLFWFPLSSRPRSWRPSDVFWKDYQRYCVAFGRVQRWWRNRPTSGPLKGHTPQEDGMQGEVVQGVAQTCDMACCGGCVPSGKLFMGHNNYILCLVFCLGPDNCTHDQNTEQELRQQRPPLQWDHNGSQGLSELPLSASHWGSQWHIWQEAVSAPHCLFHLCAHTFHQGETLNCGQMWT